MDSMAFPNPGRASATSSYRGIASQARGLRPLAFCSFHLRYSISEAVRYITLADLQLAIMRYSGPNLLARSYLDGL